MINEKLNRIEEELHNIKEMTNIEYFKRVEKQCERVNNANDYLLKKNNEIKYERDKYKKIIDKAINYIEEHTNNGMFELRTDTGEIEELLDILKGE